MMPRLRAIFLLGFWFTGIAIIAPFMILLTLITKNEGCIYRPVRFFVKLGLALVGVRVAVTGIETLTPGQPYIFTPNHQSMIEVPLFVTYLGCNPAYLAKKELFKYPIFGFGISLIGAVPVDRKNTQSAIESAQLATEKLRAGKPYVIYPEGTRSADGRLLPFKKGAFVMAVDAGVPIVPVTVRGASGIMPKGKIRIIPSTIHITIHPPVSTDGYSKENIIELVEIVRGKVASAL